MAATNVNRKFIDAPMLAKMFLGGAQNLEAKKEWINELNVFPVPDGDTGTNMSMTVMSAAREISAIQEINMDTLAKAISSGSLRGARGNSGVIVSQLFRGFTRVMKGKTYLSSEDIAEAFARGVETAYKAVMKPKEGTILTVAKAAAEKAAELAKAKQKDPGTFFEQILAHAELTLKKTPDMLPVLKEAGVVDSGGQGLVEIYRGMIAAYYGREITLEVQPEQAMTVTKISAETEAEIKFGYCTEFIIMLNKALSEEEEDEFRSFLESLGDSIVLVADEELVKVHVHTNAPGVAITKALTYGPLTKMKIDNMRQEHQEKLFKDAMKLAEEQKKQNRKKDKKKEEPKKKFGFVTISAGNGLKEIFRDLGADVVIEGGQTMNPSTEDIVKAVEEIHAEHVFLFPNNKNIILAANQAKDLIEEQDPDKKVSVIPTKTVPQGITALVSFFPEKTAEENEAEMKQEIDAVKTGQVTYAVRDTMIDQIPIKKGDIMGIGDSGLLSSGSGIEDVSFEMVQKMMEEDSELISIYYGEEVSENEAEKLMKRLSEEFPDCDIEVHEGGQPIYYYLISVE